MTTYRHTPEMGEISGFGGGYENACQDMLEKGVQWLIENGTDKLKGHTYKSIYGVFTPDSPEAKKLSAHITAGMDCTGAMHQAVMSRLFYIAKHGWDKYCDGLQNGGAT